MIPELQAQRVLLIVESPNKTSHISQYLKKAGYTNVNVMASVGHISGIKDGGNYWNTGIDPQNGFTMDLAISDNKYDIVNRLKEKAKDADLVYLGTDGDNEGAQIAWSLIKFLDIPENKCRRFITHEITPKAVVQAFENPVPMDTLNAMAAQARMALDKIVGYRLSPIAKTYVGARSVGRCQSAGLKLIVDREKEIRNFIPEKYFDLYVAFAKNGTEFRAKYVGTPNTQIDHLASQDQVDAVVAACTGDYVISDIAKREKTESPKPPFCTATFQQEAAGKLGLSVKDAMSCAQKLFETGKITYMRTDDTSMSPEFISTLKPYIEATYGKQQYNEPKKGKKQAGAQEGHECLRVTNPSLTPADLEKTGQYNSLIAKVYKIIWQRTIAAALPCAKISETVYSILNSNQKFVLTSNELIDEGYRKVYSYRDASEDKDSDGLVKETFIVGEKLAIVTDAKVKSAKNKAEKNLGNGLIVTAKETTPPPRYSEATFIKALQKLEIGRPSTYANIVETVLSSTRGYCTLNNKSMTPTDLGITLSEFLDRAFSNIINIEYTKEMEKSLDLIASGKLEKLAFLTDFYNMLESTISSSSEVKNAANPLKDADAPACPKCGSTMVVRRSRYGKLFYGCSKYPTCNGIIGIK